MFEPKISRDRRVKALTIVMALMLSTHAAALADPSFGMNCDDPVYWATDEMYVDLLEHAGNFGGGQPPHYVQTDANGWPLEDSNTLWCQPGYPDGQYFFTMKGSATPDFTVLGSLVSGSLQVSKDSNNVKTTTAYVNMHCAPPVLGQYSQNANVDYRWLGLRNIDPTDPPHDIHLYIPEVGSNPPTSLFSKTFKAGLQPFACMRMMGFMGTNASAVVKWSDRPNPTFYGVDNRGASYERMIDLCNELGRDIWINVPYLASSDGSDDWSKNMAQLLAKRLNPKLHVYLEFGNELWNWGGYPFWQAWNYVDQLAQSDSSLPPNDGAWARHGDEVLKLLVHQIGIFQPILGSRVRPILAGQFGNDIYLQAGLAYAKATYGDPKNYLYGIAVAPYLGGGSDSTTADQLFQSMNDYLDGPMTINMSNEAALAKSYGLKYLAYEAGVGILPVNQAQWNLMYAAQQDSRMGVLIQKFGDKWAALGGDLCCFLVYCAPWSANSFYGILTDMRELASGNPTVRYAASVALCSKYNPPPIQGGNNPPSPPNLGGGRRPPPTDGRGDKYSPPWNKHGKSMKPRKSWPPINGHPSRP